MGFQTILDKPGIPHDFNDLSGLSEATPAPTGSDRTDRGKVAIFVIFHGSKHVGFLVLKRGEI